MVFLRNFLISQINFKSLLKKWMFYVLELIDGEIKMFFSVIDVNHMLKYVLANL